MADLRDLLARLGGTAETQDSPPTYRQPSVSSPLASPSPSGPEPHHPSAIISPNTSVVNTPAPEASSASATRASGAPDLLSLLKFRTGTGAQAATSPPSISRASTSDRPSNILPSTETQAGHLDRASSGVLPSFVRKPSGLSSTKSPGPAPPMSSRPELRGEASGSSTNPQDFLLSLLNQASAPARDTASLKSSITGPRSPLPAEMPEAVTDDLAQDVKDAATEDTSLSPQASRTEDRKSSPIRVFGTPSEEPSGFEAPPAATKGNVFTYVNPFEQLSASSPRNQTPKPGSRTATPVGETGEKVSSHSSKKIRKASPEQPTSSTPEPTTEEPPTSASLPLRPETVSEAVSEVGGQVNKEVAETLAQVVSQTLGESVEEAEKEVIEAAAEIKQELEDEDTRETMEAGMPKPMAQAFEATIAAAANEGSGDAKDPDTVASKVRVYNFPMRPFVSIDVKKVEPMLVTSDMTSDITRMKKDFDQIDRNLVTASQNFIVYALKDAGIRVIRQFNGENKQVCIDGFLPYCCTQCNDSDEENANNMEVFEKTKERVFNVLLGHSWDKDRGHDRDTETVLATGVDGTVFWTSLLDFPGDNDYENEAEQRGFIFKPVASADDNQAGGQLKTRVKASTRHAEFFAYGRGKSIYIVWPGLARDSSFTNSDRVCDTEAYFEHYKLSIHTNKAAKDFTFSADDSVIASLDKVGKIKFWDIRKLTDPTIAMATAKRDGRSETIKDPIMALATHVPDQKNWPTSLMFIDKERPMTKGIALRYLVVGMKQNHTLQLWDLALGKAVQEINFPHDAESDAICSVAYHPKTGILVVGHPTRNTIYLLHVSTPRYALNPISQAKYMSMIAAKDTSLPPPDSTIIVSGVREYELSKRGQLRSLDILDDSAERAPEADAPYFELYCMQSKGISIVAIGRQHLGWSRDGKILNGIDGQAEGAITLKPLVQPSQTSSSDATSTNGDGASKKAVPTPVMNKSALRLAPKPQPAETVATAGSSVVDTSGDKADKKKKKKALNTGSPAPAVSGPVQPKSPELEAVTENDTVRPSVETDDATPAWVPAFTEALVNAVKAGPSATSGEVNNDTVTGLDKSINTQFNNLYRKINEDRRVMDAANNAKQDALLRLVSSTLNENIEPTMDRIVSETLKKMLLGPVKDILVQNVDRNLAESFSQSMKKAIPREIENVLPPTLKAVMQDQSLLAHLTERVVQAVDIHVRRIFEAVFEEAFVPAFTNLSMDSGRKIAHEVGRTVNEQLRMADAKHQQDAAKIDALTKQVYDLRQSMTSLIENQTQFQMQLIDVLRENRAQGGAAPTQNVAPTAQAAPPAPVVQKTPEQEEEEEIDGLLRSREYEQACVKWLQSARQIELFDQVFVKHSPAQILTNVSSLVLLSIAATVTASLKTSILQRMDWLEIALQLINPKDEAFAGYFTNIMDVITARLHKTYVDIAESNPSTQVLRRISAIASKANELKNIASSPRYPTSAGAAV